MDLVTVSLELAEKMRSTTEPFLLVDDAGKVLACFQVENRDIVRVRQGKSPFTREQTEEHRKQTGSKSLAEIKAKLREHD